MAETAASYVRETNTDTNVPYDVKFAKLIEICQGAKKEGYSLVSVHSPAVLGDTYRELVRSLELIAQYRLKLLIMPADARGEPDASARRLAVVELPRPQLSHAGITDRGKLIEAYLGSVLSAQLRTLGLDDLSQTIVINDVLTIASFKWLTRNPEKLYRVMDAVLLMDKSIITGNYIIARDGVMARDPLLRPRHFESEIPAMFQNTRGLTRTHREIMARVVRG
jgi:hypothetical protein